MLSADASTSPWNRTSPSRPASATATALRSFATSIPTNASLISAMVRPPMVRRGSYHSPGHRGAASLIRVAPHRERTYGLTLPLLSAKPNLGRPVTWRPLCVTRQGPRAGPRPSRKENVNACTNGRGRLRLRPTSRERHGHFPATRQGTGPRAATFLVRFSAGQRNGPMPVQEARDEAHAKDDAHGVAALKRRAIADARDLLRHADEPCRTCLAASTTRRPLETPEPRPPG